jgi:hypothetical protein
MLNVDGDQPSKLADDVKEFALGVLLDKELRGFQSNGSSYLLNPYFRFQNKALSGHHSATC